MNKKIVQLSIVALVLAALNWTSCTSQPSSESTSDSTALNANNASEVNAEKQEATSYFLPA